MKKISKLQQLFATRLSRLALLCSAITVALLLALWQLNTPSGALRQAVTPAALRGEAAIAHLKEQGVDGSLREAIQAARYGASWAEQTPFRQPAFHASNPAQRFDAYFTPQGVRVFAGATSVSLRPRRIGYGARQLALSESAPAIHGNRIEYDRQFLSAEQSAIRNPQSAIKEWFVNGATGLEHGFTLGSAPGERQAGESLRLTMALAGGWQAELQADGQGLLLTDEASGRRLSYAGLKVWDSAKRQLPATMKLDGREVTLEVDDAEAAYPVTIDPTFTEFNKLTANDGAANDVFGSSVAVDGDTAIIGSPGDDSGRGSAYVFVKSGANWSFQQKLTAGDGGVEDRFGISVDVSGNLAVVGQYATSEFAAHAFRGGAYIFVRSGTTWSQQQLLTSGTTSDSYGVAVGISGTTATAGAPDDSTAALSRGAVYVYTQGPSPFFIWSQQQKLLPGGSDLAANDNFGRTVAINPGNNNLLMIGAPRHLANRGAVYYFSRSGSTWTQQQRLLSSDGISGDFFGEALAFDATTLVAGAPKYNPGGQANRGAAYVFVQSGASYVQQAGPLVASDAAGGDQFGFSVAVSGDTAIFGTPGDDIDVNANQGSAYLYERSGASWTAKQKLTASDGAANNSFGAAVGVSGNNAMAGAFGNASNRGAAYSFNGSSAFPKQTQLLAGDPANLDEFGSAVAISGDTVVVGAPRDDISPATDRGSAYVFIRTHTPPAAPVWTQQQKLTASDGIANDLFGQTVAISGDVLIVGRVGGAYIYDRTGSAWTERANLTPSPGSQLFGASVGVFGLTAIVGAPGDDTGGTDRGAAHVYVKNGATWQLQQKITAADGADSDNFGGAVAMGEDTALIGAANDDNGGGLTDEGSAYVFTRSGTAWFFQAKLLSIDAAPNRSFGASVALSGNSALIGTPDDNNSTGAAYVFLRTGTTWGQQQKLFASDKGVGDRFGKSVGISGNMAVVGAWLDVVHGKLLQGSAYVFTRGGTTWTQAQRLAADLATGTAEDYFGASVAASGDTVAVGAPFDDVNIVNQGSVCVFDNWPTAKIDLAPTTLANGAVGSAYSQTLAGSGGAGPYTFSLIGGVLPAGLTLSSAGALSGTPTSGGVFSFTVLAADALGCSGPRGYTLTVTAPPQNLLVNTFADENGTNPGACSLREAITAANTNAAFGGCPAGSPGLDNISLTGIGLAYAVTTQLPDITEPITIDGATGNGGFPRAVLSGPLTATCPDLTGISGLVVLGGDSTVRNLVVNRFSHGIVLASSNNVVEGCFVGTDAAGASAAPNGIGIEVTGLGVNPPPPLNNRIGGTTAAQRNVISGNANGMIIRFNSSGTLVQGNYIGTDATGSVDLGNCYQGIYLSHTNNNTIGGTVAGARNVISANNNEGIRITDGASSNTIQGNYIGTNAAGTSGLGNLSGILIVGSDPMTNNSIGGTTASAGNSIAFNITSGIATTSGNHTGNAILGNSIHSNAGQGIDLLNDGVTPNDGDDSDTGPNNLQNFPVLTDAVSYNNGTPTTSLLGLLQSQASKSYKIQFFANNACDTSGNGEGQTFLGETTITTGVSGLGLINLSLPVPLTNTQFVTATATDVATNDTSEFSACRQVVTPTIAISDVTASEGNAGTTNFDFTLTLSVPAPGTGVSVSYATANGTAIAPGDYTALSNNSVFFLAGQTTRTVTVAVNGDTALEPNETFFVNLSNVANATVMDGQGLGTIVNDDSVGISPASLPAGTLGAAYSQMLTGSNGTAPYSFAVTAGALPAGLTLASGGALNGAPTAPGTFNFTVTATDANSFTGTRAYSLLINCQTITVNPATLSGGTVGLAYSQTVTQTGGNGATTFSVSAGTLPNGLTLSGAGLISGMPTANGNFDFTITATDSGGCTGGRVYTIAIGSCPAIIINPATLTNGAIGAAYSQTLTATGGASPYGFAVTAGALPAGLTLAAGGLLSGTPTASGSFSFTVAATDNNGCIGTRVYTLLICGTITVNPVSLPAGALGVAYNQTITQTGASTPTFSISAGALPGGLSLNASTGALTGTPTATGTANFTVRATDANGCFGERAYTLTINACGSVTVNPIVLSSAVLGMNYFQTMTATGGVAPYGFAVSAGALPGGLSLAANGQLTGAPTAIGNSTFTVKATDASGCMGTRQYTLFVNRKFELVASDGGAVDHFGFGAKISGDTVIIGSPLDDIGANADQGSAYIYIRSGGTWIQQQKLTAGDGAAGDFFGYAVAIQGDTVVVGAYLADVDAQADRGAAYVFTRNGGVWTQQQKLTGADGAASNQFGFSVAVNNETAIAGALYHNGATGAAYVFTRTGTVWAQQQKLLASDGAGSDLFGSSVAIEENTAVVGAVLDDIGATTDQGSAYVFTRSGSFWTEQQKLVADDGGLGDSFGNSVVISGNTVLIGAHQGNVPGQTQPGAAYAFTRSGSVWTQQQKLTASGGNPGDAFGNNVALEGNLAVVGDNLFFARTFVRSGATWSEQQKLQVSSQIRGVGVSNGVIVAGAQTTTVGGNAEQGSACIFDNCPPITITPSTLPDGGVNSSYNQTLTASGGSSPYTFSTIGGALPAGLNLSAAGVLSGTPTATGTFNFIVRATATGGCTGTQSYTLIIGACPTITVNPTTLPNTAFGANYNQTLTATGGAEPYNFTVTAGALPAGLVLVQFGVLSGPVNATGTFSFAVRATDQNGCFGERMYTIVVGGCATLTVNSLGDTPDANAGNGLCADAGGQCTLRAAIQESNALGCGTTINFSVTGTINVGSFLPALFTNATINGPGADLLTVRRDGAAAFSVLSSFTASATISGLTITNGAGVVTSKGGGVFSNGGLTINNCIITGNQSGEGGGIWATGALTVNNTTIANNTAITGTTGGGGVHLSACLASFTNSTISGNSATGGGGDGGGVYNTFGSLTTLTNCTLTANTATDRGGGFDVRSGGLTAVNTIFAGNTSANGPDIDGTLTSQGNNLIGNTAGVTGLIASDLQNVNPRLAPLANNGSPMPTHALRCDSPAIDAGTSTGAPANDQRGLARNADGNGDDANAVDIGALEVQKLVVTNTNDTGAGSLRQALLDNNATGGSLIAFNIAGAGVKTIAPLSALPAITKTVDINGYTQPGSSVNTLERGTNAALLIELNGASAGVVSGLSLNAAFSCVRGLAINRFAASSRRAIEIVGTSSDNLITGNFIGTNPAGTAGLGNQDGIDIFTANNVIGGTTLAARNLLSGNATFALALSGVTATNNLVQGNLIGTNAAGTAALPNATSATTAVLLTSGANGNIIGGTVAGARNVISGNAAIGIALQFAGTSNNQILGNAIGTDVSGTVALGNSGVGVGVDAPNNSIGGVAMGAGNLIAFNGSTGVSIFNLAMTNNRVLGNSIFENVSRGISLGGSPLTPNDPGDPDTGPNNLQNFPVLNPIAAAGTVTGSLDSLPANSAYPIRLEFFANTACDASGNGEGEVFLGFTTLAAPGNFTFNYTPVAGKPFITATATDDNGNTSEFSACRADVSCPAITVTPANPVLPVGIAGQPYSQTFTATGGSAPYIFTISAGTLPGGLTLSNGGVFSGSPTAFGNFSFTVQATDANSCVGERAYTLVINAACGSVTVNPAPPIPNGFVGTAYSQTFTATGGTVPYNFSVSAGTPPNGLTLNASTGILSGTPAAIGSFTFTVRATDANGCMGTREYNNVLISGNGLMFYPLPQPVRALETRAGFSGCVNPGNPVNAGSTFTLPVQGACTGIPANAAAVTGNITVVPSAGGFLTLFPSSAAQPTVANCNFAAGEITNNVFTVALGAGDGAFKIFTNATTHIIADVTGYFAPPGTGGLFYYPLPAPVRLVETRSGEVGCFQPPQLQGTNDLNSDPNLDLPVPGRGPGLPSACNSIPASAQVLVGNATSVFPAGGGHLTIYPSGGTRPTVASSNYAGADVINGPFAVKLGADGMFKVYTFATTHLVIDVLGYYSEDALDANGPGLLFNPLPAPVRLLETRPDFPGFPLTGCTRTNAPIPGNLAMATHTQQARNFCGLPASAQAVVGNVSVVNSTGAGYLTLFAGNLTTAPLVATSNYPAPATFGYNRHYFVGLSPTDGTFKVLTQFTTDLILDASGYFAP